MQSANLNLSIEKIPHVIRDGTLSWSLFDLDHFEAARRLRNILE